MRAWVARVADKGRKLRTRGNYESDFVRINTFHDDAGVVCFGRQFDASKGREGVVENRNRGQEYFNRGARGCMIKLETATKTLEEKIPEKQNCTFLVKEKTSSHKFFSSLRFSVKMFIFTSTY